MFLAMCLACSFLVGCVDDQNAPDDEDVEESVLVDCDVTEDLDEDGCNDAVCKILLPEGSKLGDSTLTEDLVLTLEYDGSCANPQDIVLNPDCGTDIDVTDDGCADAVCQLPSGVAVFEGQCE